QRPPDVSAEAPVTRLSPFITRRVRENRHHVWCERVQHFPCDVGTLTTVDAHLKRRRLPHHPRARWTDAIEVLQHASVPIGLELRRDGLDRRSRIDPAR